MAVVSVNLAAYFDEHVVGMRALQKRKQHEVQLDNIVSDCRKSFKKSTFGLRQPGALVMVAHVKHTNNHTHAHAHKLTQTRPDAPSQKKQETCTKVTSRSEILKTY